MVMRAQNPAQGSNEADIGAILPRRQHVSIRSQSMFFHVLEVARGLEVGTGFRKDATCGGGEEGELETKYRVRCTQYMRHGSRR